jgi:mannitol-1-phosphate/altronate dehydrogenase
MTDQELIKKFYESIKEEPEYPKFSLGWYANQFPEPYRSQAIQNTIDQLGRDTLFKLNTSYEEIDHFLQYSKYAFIWDKSPQGKDYWVKFFRNHLFV